MATIGCFDRNGVALKGGGHLFPLQREIGTGDTPVVTPQLLLEDVTDHVRFKHTDHVNQWKYRKLQRLHRKRPREQACVQYEICYNSVAFQLLF
jgi:hypothetical protein